MNYLIFDNDIYYETKDTSGIVPKDQLNTIFTGPDKDCVVAVIDTLQKQLVAPEKLTSKKDEVIASGFTGHHLRGGKVPIFEETEVAAGNNAH